MYTTVAKNFSTAAGYAAHCLFHEKCAAATLRYVQRGRKFRSSPHVASNPFVNNEFFCAFSELAQAAKMPMKERLPPGEMHVCAAKWARADFSDTAMTIGRRRVVRRRDGANANLSQIPKRMQQG
jgi:hypothetical protein